MSEKTYGIKGASMTLKHLGYALLWFTTLAIGMELGYRIHANVPRRPSYPGNVPGMGSYHG